MLWVYNEIHREQQARLARARSTINENEFMLYAVAQKMIRQNTILMLDEFMLPDIALAHIVSILFTYYFKLGGVLVATSNKLPEELYGGQFQRNKFNKFVNVLHYRCEMVEMRGGRDYRVGDVVDGDTNRYPDTNTIRDTNINESTNTIGDTNINESTNTTLSTNTTNPTTNPTNTTTTHLIIIHNNPNHETQWNTLLTSHHNLPSSSNFTSFTQKSSVSVYNRSILLPTTLGQSCYLDFSYICQGLFSAPDYITIASNYNTIILDNVPIMTTKMKNEARRFITLLDAIYETKCQLFMRSQVPIDYLFFPDASDDTPEDIRNLIVTSVDENLQVQEEEMYARTAIDLNSPYRPNVAMYDENHTSEHKPENHKNPDVSDYKNITAFTGQDEKFAYKRAVLRIKQMLGSERWKSEAWIPLHEVMRPWEKPRDIEPKSRPQEAIDESLQEEIHALTKDKEALMHKLPRDISEQWNIPFGQFNRLFAPKFGSQHFWSMGQWNTVKRLKDGIALAWIKGRK